MSRNLVTTLWQRSVVGYLIRFVDELSTPHCSPGPNRRRLLALPLAAGLGACAGNTPAVLMNPNEPAPSLKEAFARLMPFGSAVTPAQLRGPEAAFIAHHFNMLVAENVMKPEFLVPTQEGQYALAAADGLVSFARAHGMQVRGHTLMWHRQMPPWFFKEGAGTVSRALLIARIERYIADVVGRFKGRVYAWDVLNEAIVADEPGAVVDANGLREAELYKIIGPEYIEIVFRAAAKADPDALLFYNDYETQNPKKGRDDFAPRARVESQRCEDRRHRPPGALQRRASATPTPGSRSGR
jgi:endo-1,4-beta-xylanase